MMPLLIAYGIEFVVQAALIFAGLWIMIALQKLNNHILGLLGTAALASGLEMALDRWLGIYISTSITIGVMQVCIWKVTGASNPFDIDVLFTVAVGGALTFAMNMFLMGALMGELRAFTNEDGDEPVAQLMEEMEPADESPSAAPSQPTGVKSNVVPVASQKPAAPAKAAAGKISEATLKSLTLKGLNSGARPLATLSDGKRTFSLGIGESRALPTADGLLTVRLERVTATSAIISLNGQSVELSMF